MLRVMRKAVTMMIGVVVVGLAITACGSGTKHSSTAATTATASADPALSKLLPASIRSAGVVNVATDMPYPPFEFFADESGSKITGFDYDYGQALGQLLGVRFHFAEQKFDGIIPALQAGRYTITISAMTDTPDRRKVLDFVDYSRAGTALMVPKGNPKGIKTVLDLCGRTAALQSGAQQLGFLKTQQPKCKALGKPPINIAAVPKQSDAQLMVTSGKADAVMEDTPSGAYEAKTIGNGDVFEIIDDPAAAGGYDARPTGIGIPKGNQELVNALQKATQALMDNGTYKKLLDKYGVGAIAIPTATINGKG
ncbi:MAG TPA: ABC transporter substrate-binding protein [Conexibacter sp.]|nr:ABC transporter substrate-binding protein [Conexibacter sp.]